METLYSRFFQTISDIARHLGVGLILWPTWNCKCSTSLRFGCWFMRPVEGHGKHSGFVASTWSEHSPRTAVWFRSILIQEHSCKDCSLQSVTSILTWVATHRIVLHSVPAGAKTILYLAVLASSPYLSGSFGICDPIFCNLFPLSLCLLFANHPLIFWGSLILFLFL